MFTLKALRLERISVKQAILLALAFLLGVLIICIAILVLSPGARMQTVQTTLDVMGANLPEDEHGHTNILLLGTGDENHDGADLTDTMIIASIDPSTRSVVMMSLPRDLYLDANRRLVNGRINAVFALEKYRLMREGIKEDEAAMQAMQEVATEMGEKLGLQIHGVMKADFTAFETVVDALGGVDVIVPETLTDYSYPLTETTVGTFRLEKGPQHLDGETALRYARSRHSTNDFDRSARQQQLLTAMADKVRGMGRINQVSFLIDLNEKLVGHISTTMTSDQVLGLAQIAQSLAMDRVITMQLNFSTGSDYLEASPGGFVYPAPPEMFSGASILLPLALPGRSSDWTQIRAFVHFLTQERPAYLAQPVILMNDLGAKQTHAFRLRNELLRYGFSVLPLESPDTDTPPVESTVYYRTDTGFAAAEFIGDLLGLPVAKESGSTGSGDVLIQIGSGFIHKPFATMSGATLNGD